MCRINSVGRYGPATLVAFLETIFIFFLYYRRADQEKLIIMFRTFKRNHNVTPLYQAWLTVTFLNGRRQRGRENGLFWPLSQCPNSQIPTQICPPRKIACTSIHEKSHKTWPCMVSSPLTTVLYMNHWWGANLGYNYMNSDLMLTIRGMHWGRIQFRCQMSVSHEWSTNIPLQWIPRRERFDSTRNRKMGYIVCWTLLAICLWLCISKH